MDLTVRDIVRQAVTAAYWEKDQEALARIADEATKLIVPIGDLPIFDSAEDIDDFVSRAGSQQ